MKAIWDFMCYCLLSMFGVLSSTIGHVPKDFTWKDTVVGIITLIVILCILILLGKMLGIISFKKGK